MSSSVTGVFASLCFLAFVTVADELCMQTDWLTDSLTLADWLTDAYRLTNWLTALTGWLTGRTIYMPCMVSACRSIRLPIHLPIYTNLPAYLRTHLHTHLLLYAQNSSFHKHMFQSSSHCHRWLSSLTTIWYHAIIVVDCVCDVFCNFSCWTFFYL